MRGNPGNLRRAAAKSAAATRAEVGLTRMSRSGDPFTFRGLARTVGVSLDFLYRTPDIRHRVEQLRAEQNSAAPPAAARPPDPDQPSSVIRTLTTPLAELKRRHRDEVSALNLALESAHGENLELRRRLAHHGAHMESAATPP